MDLRPRVLNNRNRVRKTIDVALRNRVAAGKHKCYREQSRHGNGYFCAHDLTRHKISDRESTKGRHAAKGWMAITPDISRSLARGSLHRLVRPIASLNHEVVLARGGLTNLFSFHPQRMGALPLPSLWLPALPSCLYNAYGKEGKQKSRSAENRLLRKNALE
jgi:hypothetical protein